MPISCDRVSLRRVSQLKVSGGGQLRRRALANADSAPVSLDFRSFTSGGFVLRATSATSHDDPTEPPEDAPSIR